MSKYIESIDEIAEAADKLCGDGYGGEARAIAIQCATQIWFQHEQDRRQADYERKINEAQAAATEARQQLFRTPQG